ncbi:MAG TPA: polysaccharide deacetylase family protein [Draconibacterium sp.]|nr:polysaccharide deacetylase family protein [Draconibacterium sp.]
MKKIFFLLTALLIFSTVKGVCNNIEEDYSTNEIIMDSIASHSFHLVPLKYEGRIQTEKEKFEKDKTGAIVRINPEKQNIYLVFTADSLFEGGEQILDILNAHQIKGSFFFTGNFLRNRNHKRIIQKIIKDGHYVGPHSDKHLLYCDWKNQDSTLITFEKFKTDLDNNYKALKRFGVQRKEAAYFIPPYEWCNRQIVDWCTKLGIEVVNFTPGTGTNEDNTTPKMENYKSSEKIWENLKIFEEYRPEHLNGAILLIHPGTKPARKDKFYNLLDELIEYMYTNGYRFKSLKSSDD